MRGSVSWGICVAGTFLAACGGERRFDESYRAALADSLVGHADEMLATLRRMDVENVVAMYGRTGTFVHVENGHKVPWQQLEPQMRQYFAAATQNDIQWLDRPRVLVLDENAAVVWGRHRFRSDTDPHDGVWTGVLERIGGVWRIVHSHSSDTPEAGGL